ncbi:uncharacterized protein At2g39795, mitochondrial-like [Tripterygium wilfordii]|nr:uncharacterized protein At2g39795, mitochondrial-like [Tripterygium wilfordii]
MARLIRNAQRTLFSSCSSSTTLIHGLRRHEYCNWISHSSLPLQIRLYAANKITKSPFKENILRILRNEISYQTEYAPPHEPATRFNSFIVEDRPGEQWITMRGRHNDIEDIKIEVTMFDGFKLIPKPGEDASGEDVALHISLLVDITRENDGHKLEFACSAWTDCLEIQKVYIFSHDTMLSRPYMGPDFRKLNGNLQKELHGFLEARGVNNELSTFLHEHIMNKDRIELIKWLEKLKSFMEK